MARMMPFFSLALATCYCFTSLDLKAVFLSFSRILFSLVIQGFWFACEFVSGDGVHVVLDDNTIVVYSSRS